MKHINNFNKFLNESIYGHDITSGDMVDKDWDELYEDAKKEPIKSRIKKLLVKIFKNKEIMVRVADHYEWSDGSNGFINFSNLNHFINDVGYKTYADNPSLIDDIEGFKDNILDSYASSPGDYRRGEKYRNFKYNPNEDFSW